MATRLLTSTAATMTVYPSGTVPNYIASLAPGAALQVPSKISDAFQGFAGEAGDPLGVYAYSGAAYDTKRGRYMRSGGGHNDHNGNGVYGFSPYASETPRWVLFRTHTSPPSVTDFVTRSVESSANGDPASTHTYNQIVYDGHNDKFVLVGTGSNAGSNGAGFPRLRSLNLTTNQWDPITSRPSKPGQGGGSFACYDGLARAVWCKEGALNYGLIRYDAVTDTLVETNDGLSKFNIDVAVAVDPQRKIMIAIGGYGNVGPLEDGSADIVLWDLSTYNGTSVRAYARRLNGFPVALRSAKISVEFHPPSGSFVSWLGGNLLYRLIPPTDPFTGAWTIVTVTPTGTPLPAIASGSLGGVYSKFRWAPYPNDPTRGVFVMDCAQGSPGNYTASNLALYKPNF
jgi:hypothetical protein